MPVRPYVGTFAAWTAESSPVSDGSVYAFKVTANMNVIAKDLGFAISLSDENAKFGIYDHNSGDDEPENLLGATGIVTNSAERASPVWTFGDLGSDVYLQRLETYWFAILFEYGQGGTGTDAWFKMTNNTGRICFENATGFWPTFPDPFGVPVSCFSAGFFYPIAQARGALDITPGIVARNKDVDW